MTVEQARHEYDAARAAYERARAAMLAQAARLGTAYYDRAARKAVDALHQEMSRTYQAWWQLAHAPAA